MYNIHIKLILDISTMHGNSKIIVNVNPQLKQDFESVAQNFGLDMSNAIRLLMSNFRDGLITPQFATSLTTNGFTKNAEKKILDSSKASFVKDKVGKVVEHRNLDEMMNYLDSDE